MAELRRLLIAPQRLPDCGQSLALEREERHYLEKVLRLRCGGRFAIVDGQGSLYQAELLESGMAQLGGCLHQQPPASPELVLLLSLMRRDLDTVLRMSCELGVDQIVPLQAHRGLVDPGSKRQQRWRSQLQEACEQCERLWLPTLRPVGASLERLAVPATEGSLRCIGVTREPGVPLLSEVLEKASAQTSWQLACGPEGGWSSEERSCAIENGWQPVSLGPTILRASTAAVTGMGVLQHQRQRLSAAEFPPLL